MNISVSKLLSNFLSGLELRERGVLEGRYGLKDGNVKTLAEIGEANGITRERVRQIEASALNQLSKVSGKTDLKDFVSLVKNHLKNIGGLRREALLLSDLRVMVSDPSTSYLGNKVRFLLEVAGEPKYVSEDEQNHSYWFLAEEDKKQAMNFLSRLVKLMESKKTEVVTHGNIDSLFKEAIQPHNLKDLVALNYIAVSKQFHVNEYGDFGLSRWPETNPKTVRDWAHKILKKQKQPLHFQAISNLINKVRKNSKKVAYPQTVHNELIKDQRFVLVGRGLYGLQEFGLMPGTAKEVMARILKDRGPLEPKELLNLVLKERLLKKNTVMINLQNRKYFKRLEDGRYTAILV